MRRAVARDRFDTFAISLRVIGRCSVPNDCKTQPAVEAFDEFAVLASGLFFLCSAVHTGHADKPFFRVDVSQAEVCPIRLPLS
jgi:hypothetical protein